MLGDARTTFTDYIAERFRSSHLRLDPFPHLLINDVFPRALYDEMRANLPRFWRWKIASFSEQPMFAIRPGNPTYRGLARYAQLWQDRYQQYIDLMDKLTLEKMSDAISAHLSRLRAAGLLIGEPQIALGQSVFCQRTKEWFIPAHTHDIVQLLQTMVYFPLPGSFEDQGTVFYEGAQLVDKRSLFATVVFNNALSKITVPYRHNFLVSFLNTPRAVHSSATVQGPPRRYIFTGALMNRSAFNEQPQGSIHTSAF